MDIQKPSIRYVCGTGGDYSIEEAARTCYKSEDEMTTNSDKQMVRKLIKSEHHAMLEFGWMFYKVICDRGVTHEIVRHRMFSYAQESTRYCNYSGGVTFVMPCWMYNECSDGEYLLTDEFESNLDKPSHIWHMQMLRAEGAYLKLTKQGWLPQQARSVLPNSLKTEICIAGNFREWRHFFELRTAKSAHPQMIEVANMILEDAVKRHSELFKEYLK